VRGNVNEKGEGKKGFKMISLIKRFNCRVKDLFEILWMRIGGGVFVRITIDREDSLTEGFNLNGDDALFVFSGWYLVHL